MPISKPLSLQALDLLGASVKNPKKPQKGDPRALVQLGRQQLAQALPLLSAETKLQLERILNDLDNEVISTVEDENG